MNQFQAENDELRWDAKLLGHAIDGLKQRITELEAVQKTMAERVTELAAERDSLQRQVDMHWEGAQKAAKEIVELMAERDKLRDEINRVDTNSRRVHNENERLRTRLRTGKCEECGDKLDENGDCQRCDFFG